MSNLSLPSLTSRRRFLQGTAALAAGQGLLRSAWAKTESTMRAYVGTYNGDIGNQANGEGIYLFEMDRQTGALTGSRLVARSADPSWIVIHPSRRYLYAVNEVDNYQGKSGSVSSFAIDGNSGDLSPLNVVSSEGGGPAYISLDAAGKFAFVANYGGGSLAVLPIHADGSLGTAVDVKRDQGSVGSQRATNAPQGSFAISGHDAPHVHIALADPHNRFVLATDLGQDRIYVYPFDSQTGKLGDNPVTASLPSGDGPRHLAFHPNGRWLYSIQEEASTVVQFDFDAQSGALAAKQTVSSLAPGFSGTSFASEILIGPDGRFLYAANRLANTVAVFAIGAEGRLERVGEAAVMGDYPSQCRIDPSGHFLFACNRRSDNITSFRIDRKTGLLTFIGYTGVGSPGSITFVD